MAGAHTRKPSRAVGVIRVSRTGGREGDSFASPDDQRQRVEQECSRLGLDLVGVYEELDISGRLPLEKRRGLLPAIADVEGGRADVVVTAYFDRLCRSLRVQDEVVSRVERAGGQVLAVDVGQVTNGSAAQWLSSTMLGAMNEYYSRSVGERVRDSQVRAVARGVPPFTNIPPGYVRGKDGTLDIDPVTAPLVIAAFGMRAEGETIKEIRRFLHHGGIERSYHGVQSMLGSCIYLGEIRFGELVNLAAHEPLISPEVWRTVQGVKVSRGRRPVVDSLLGRLGLLRCGTCGKPLVTNTVKLKGARYKGGVYHFRTYRCPPAEDNCSGRVSIGANIVEGVVTEAVKEALGDITGRAAAHDRAREAEAVAAQAQDALESALRTFAGFEDEAAARERLNDLRAVRDEALERTRELSGTSASLLLTAADWDRLTLAERRGLIRSIVRGIYVARSGRGPGRVRVDFFI